MRNLCQTSFPERMMTQSILSSPARGPFHHHAMLRGLEAGPSDRECSISPIRCDNPTLPFMTLMRKIATGFYHGVLTWVYDNYITGKAVSEYITEEQYADSCSTIVMSKGQGDFDANAFDCQDGLSNFHLVCLCWAVAKTEHEHNRAGYIYDPVYFNYITAVILDSNSIIFGVSGVFTSASPKDWRLR